MNVKCRQHAQILLVNPILLADKQPDDHVCHQFYKANDYKGEIEVCDSE
jgi:hypothetical protein